MSDTAEAPTAIPEIANFSVAPGADFDGNRTTKVTFGTRSAEFRELNLADSWDLLEISGEQTNDTWLNMALMATALTALDGVPIPVVKAGITKRELRERMKNLGGDGMQALAKAMAASARTASDAVSVTATAKNF